MKEAIAALQRVSHLSIGTVGDMCKTDLTTIAYACGLNDSEIRENIPELFTREEESEPEEENLDAEKEIDDDYDPTQDDNKLDELNK